MKQKVLLCFFVVANLMEVTLLTPLSTLPAYDKLFNIFEKCRSNDVSRWSKKVTIDGKEKLTHPPLVSTKPNKTSEGFIDWIMNTPSKITRWISNISTNISETVSWIWGTPTSIEGRTEDKAFKSVCSAIPEPIVIPDVDLKEVFTFRAFNGSISGIRRMCERHSYLPSLTRKSLKFGLKFKLDLQGLSFKYHVIVDHLHINRTFNWTLGAGSFAKMNLMPGFSSSCPVRIEDIDIFVDLDGKYGGRTVDSFAFQNKLICYLYYGFVYAVGDITEYLQQAAENVMCLSIERLALRENGNDWVL